MITCFIRYDTGSYRDAFATYAATGDRRSNAPAPIRWLACEPCRSRLASDPLERENYEFARRERFIRKEDGLLLTCASLPHLERNPV